MNGAGNIGGIASAVLGLFVIGCGGRTTTTSTSSAPDQTASSPSLDSGPDVVPDSALAIIEDSRAENIDCACPSGAYWVEVAVGAEASQFYAAPYISSGEQFRCAGAPTAPPTVPYSLQHGSAGGVGLYACLTTDQTASCLAIDPPTVTPTFDIGYYVTSSRQVSILSPLHTTTTTECSDPPCVVEGQYTATLGFPDGGALTIHGTFRTCLVVAVVPITRG
jgi:hypothetical protein